MRLCINLIVFVGDCFLLWLGENTNEGDLNLFLNTERDIAQNMNGRFDWKFSRINKEFMKKKLVDNSNRIYHLNYAFPEKGDNESMRNYALYFFHLNTLPSTNDLCFFLELCKMYDPNKNKHINAVEIFQKMSNDNAYLKEHIHGKQSLH